MSGITAEDLRGLFQIFFQGDFGPMASPASAPHNLETLTGANYYTELLAAVETGINGIENGAQQYLDPSWTGIAAELASGKLTTTANSLIHTQAQLTKVRDELTSFWQKLLTYASEMRNTIYVAGNVFQFELEVDGTLSYSAGFGNPVGIAQYLIKFGLKLPSSEPYGGDFVVPRSYLVNIERAYDGAAYAQLNITIPGEAEALQRGTQDLANALEAWRAAASSQFRHLVDLANQLDSNTAAEVSKLQPPLTVTAQQANEFAVANGQAPSSLSSINTAPTNSATAAPATPSPRGGTTGP
jgi:hypothetical protein